MPALRDRTKLRSSSESSHTNGLRWWHATSCHFSPSLQKLFKIDKHDSSLPLIKMKMNKLLSKLEYFFYFCFYHLAQLRDCLVELGHIHRCGSSRQCCAVMSVLIKKFEKKNIKITVFPKFHLKTQHLNAFKRTNFSTRSGPKPSIFIGWL